MTFFLVVTQLSHSLAAQGATVAASVCANYQTSCGGECGWEAQISITKCADDTYRYRLVAPNECPVAYCAGNQPDCPSGELWDPDENSCISMLLR